MDSGPADPRVSVLILSYRHAGALNAVKSLTDSAPATSYEVRVLLNGATPDVVQAIHAGLPADWIEHSRANLGFAGGMNRLARSRASEYLVLLNDDATVTVGWLDALVSAADAVPGSGAITGRLYYPDGRLQEAGARLTLGGHGVQEGNGESELRPELAERREIDFPSCSAALIRRSAFEEIGGFDDRYFPAYFEDADLGLRLREAGWSVLYEPGAIAVHAQGQSTSEDTKRTSSGYAYELFLQTWGDSFSTDPAEATVLPPAPLPPVRRGTGAPRPIEEVDPAGMYTAWLNQQLAEQRRATENLSARLADAQVQLDQRGRDIDALNGRLADAEKRAAAEAARAQAEAVRADEHASARAAMAGTRMWRARAKVGRIARAAAARARR